MDERLDLQPTMVTTERTLSDDAERSDSEQRETIPARESIGQDELARYRDLSAQARDLSWTVERLRKSLLVRHDAGVPVDPGPLDLDVVETEQRRITNDDLVRVLGLDVVEEVRTQVKPTISRSVKIVERPSRSTAASKPRRRKVA